MITTKWNVENVDNIKEHPSIKEAAMWIREGEVIAFPTETVYGLAANAWSNEAIEKIFKAKGRPSDNPLIVHIANKRQLEQAASSWNETEERLMDRFWPGPLTIVLPKNDLIAERTTAGLESVGVRMPDHPVALGLIEACGLPLAAPSANRSGKPSPTIGEHVYQDLNGRIKGIIDGGPTGVGLESTVVEVTGETVTILRPGGITKAQLEAVVSDVKWDPALLETEQIPKSPGMKYTHYAPEAPLYLIKGDSAFFQSQIEGYQREGKKVGVLVSDELARQLRADEVKSLGSAIQIQGVAQKLYHQLRAFDETSVDVILGEIYPIEGMGEALMNRLLKAAGNRVISEDKKRD
ncbi:L-threonylcarbamoyladenylate synthase [Pseudalkalibacillus salsuginis]|uniref:L-threonylcarbamoyladenylate synthase n=1 Tax=Pseudalkalibacillus salsuginis TaxID=2910972 RepID=UPI001F35D09D|nr:L-threonylcarbamoyladenylate synthase [Pseudalkalibacillus salsuginis]MCF6410915.1 threonylcarbamoyl-AMP synthase [Pseudalkalibacillus salsuginis]